MLTQTQIDAFIEKRSRGLDIVPGTEDAQTMHDGAQDALQLTAELNNSYHTPEEIAELFERITGKPAAGISLEEAEKAVWEELDKLKTPSVSEAELEKVKNRYESEQIFNNLNYLNVATNLAYFELIGKAEDINCEVDKYRAITTGQVQETARKTFVPENCSILYYKAKNT